MPIKIQQSFTLQRSNMECEHCGQEIYGDEYECDGDTVCEDCHENAYPID